jgi:hypothetical protein
MTHDGDAAINTHPVAFKPQPRPAKRERRLRLGPNAASGAVFRFTGFDLASNGWFGGSQIGCNVQWADVVLGIETDFQAGKVKGDVLFPNAIFNFPNAPFNTAVTSELRSFGTVRGRAAAGKRWSPRA